MSSPETHRHPDPRDLADPRPAPRVVSVLGGLGAVVLLLALLAAVSPTVRDQAGLSLSRQDAAYVETYFTRVVDAQACNPGQRTFAAEMAVRSHLRAATDVPYVLTLTPARGDREPVTVEGAVTTLPERETVAQLVAPKPSRAYTVTVDFPGREQRLLLRCAGSAS